MIRTGRGCRFAGGLFAVVALVAGCAMSVAVVGLRAADPPARQRFPTFSGRLRVAFVQVDSLKPMLRWESFPRAEDQASKDAADVGNVTYDLRIYRADDEHPVEIVYSREALPEPQHRIEAALQPSTRYFWTVRARYDLKGATRVTEWATFWEGRRLGFVPNPYHYGFQTPADR